MVLARLLNFLGKFLSFLSKGNELLSNKLSIGDSELSDIRNRLVEEQSSEKQLEKELKKIESIVDICPTCGQKIPNVHKIDTTELKSKLREILPVYMLPTSLIKMDEFPLNKNGKIDRKKLSNMYKEGSK